MFYSYTDGKLGSMKRRLYVSFEKKLLDMHKNKTKNKKKIIKSDGSPYNTLPCYLTKIDDATSLGGKRLSRNRIPMI